MNKSSASPLRWSKGRSKTRSKSIPWKGWNKSKTQYALLNRTTLRSKSSERVLGVFRQTVTHKSKTRKKSWKLSVSNEWGWAHIKSPLRNAS